VLRLDAAQTQNATILGHSMILMRRRSNPLHEHKQWGLKVYAVCRVDTLTSIGGIGVLRLRMSHSIESPAPKLRLWLSQRPKAMLTHILITSRPESARRNFAIQAA
jgi:hypothetical protein